MSAICRVFALLAAVSLPATAAELRLHASSLPQLDVQALSAIVESETGVRITGTGRDGDPLQALVADEADLAIVENSRPFAKGLRAVLPLYRGVVHMAVRDDFDWENWVAGQTAPRIELAGAMHTGRLVADLLFERARGTPRDYEVWTPELGGEADFIFYVGPLLPNQTHWFRGGFSLISLSRVDSAGAEFYTEGISYLHPQLTPTRIPALTYRLPGNETGIDALAVDMLLLTRRDEDSTRIYRIVEVLLEQKARFAAAEPQLFRWLDEDFDRTHLNFPLHRGTLDYLSREEPGFLERYAETFNFIVYVVALTVTGLVGFGRWRDRARKERIDRFYERLIEMRRRAGDTPAEELLAEVDALEGEAFGLLTRERLAADDSFRIFMELAAALRRELREHG